MKKKWMSLLLALALLVSSLSTAWADDLQGKSGLKVTFNGSSIKSNYKTSELTKTATDMLPGDSLTYQISLDNDSDSDSAWYMSNSVRKSFEDKGGASGGGYSYFLSFTDQSGKETILYKSDSVGGDGEEGLREAADNLGGDELDNYFYLGTLKANSTGTTTLRITLDGETQGNDYQKDMADLRLKFAAVDADGSEASNSDKDNNRNRSNGGSNNSSSGRSTRAVKTGDETDLIPYYIAAGISGLFLLFLFFFRRKKEEEDEEEAQNEAL